MIHIVQMLCPSRHAIFAAAYDPADGETVESITAYIKEQAKRLGLNPWCGICGSRDLRFEHSVTQFKTMEEAMPPLKQNELDQALSRAQLAAEGRTYDEGGNRN